MGFSALRVINDDVIDAGQGFGTHPHKDMEILTYVLEGAVEHRQHGQQRAGAGGRVPDHERGYRVRHSEYNPSKTDRLRLYQIWIIPEETGITATSSAASPPGANSWYCRQMREMAR